MRFLVLFLCGLILATHSASRSAAQDILSDEGPYFSFGAGISDGTLATNHLGMDVLELDLTTSVYDYQNKFAVTGIAAFGYTWTPVGYTSEFRLELEGSYRRALFDQLLISNYCACGSLNSQVILDADGYLESIAAMFNGYVDFRIGDTNIMPYFGAGVGAVRVSRRNASFGGVPASGKFTHTGAWQVMGGFGYRLTPGTILGLEFRRFQTNRIDFDGFPAPQQYNQQDIMFTVRLVG